MTVRTLFALGPMTATERAAGRFLRGPDEHPAAPAPEGGGETGAETPPAEEGGEQPPAEEPQKEPTTDDLYEQEYGATSSEEDSSEGQDEGTEEGEGDDGDPNPDPKPEDTGAPKEDDAAQWKSRVEALERELAEARRQREAENKPTEEKPESSEAEDKAPDPSSYEFGEADGKYIADLARWNVRQEHAALQREQSIRAELQAIETGWKGAISAPEIVERYPDFEEKVTKGADDAKWQCSTPMALLIKNSPIGPDVAYELASNPDESARLAQMTPQELLLEFGRVEGRVQAKVEARKQPPAPAPKRTTSAPKPPTNRSRGQGGQFATEQDALYDKMLKEFN